MENDLAQLRLLAQSLLEKKKNKQGLDDIQELCSKGLLALLHLRDSTRSTAFAAEALKEEASKCKSQLEKSNLQLQNLLYEKRYFENEIQCCKNFASSYTDEQIGLMSLQEYLSRTNDIEKDDHKLMLNRLKHESNLRKEMAIKLEQLEGSRASLAAALSGQRTTLGTLQTHLTQIQKAAKPLQPVLAPCLAQQVVANAANLLPLPLYILYSQVAACIQALSLPVNVNVVGSVSEAESFAKLALRNLSATNDFPLQSGDNSDHSPNKKQKMATDTSFEPVEAMALPKVHPLSVVIELQRQPNSSARSASLTLMSVRITWLTASKLALASADVAGDNALLSALFPADDGSGFAPQSDECVVPGAPKGVPFGKHYKWLALLSGADFAPPLPLARSLPEHIQAAVKAGLDTYRRDQRVVRILSRLRAAKETDVALRTTLAGLPRNPNPTLTSIYPRTPSSVLASWEEIAAARASGPTQPTAGVPVSAPSTSGTQPPSSGKSPIIPAAVGQGSRGASQQVVVIDDARAQHRTASATPPPGTSAAAQTAAATPNTLARTPLTPLPLGPAALAYASLSCSSGTNSLQLPPSFPQPRKASLEDFGGNARTFITVLRHGTLELEMRVVIPAAYPLHPPLWVVAALREISTEKGASSAAKAVAAPNELAWLEKEVNVEPLLRVPAASRNELLLHQILSARLALDEIAALRQVEGREDAVALLRGRGRLVGRDRHGSGAMTYA